MFGNMKGGANAYATVGIETGVIAASPHKLIVMLYEGAITSITNAIFHLEKGNIAEKGKSISKAIAIIENGLRASLDKKVGGEIAISLDSLYEYMGRQLLLANLHNNADSMREVNLLLNDLKATWEAIGPKQELAEQAVPMNNTKYDDLTPRSNKFMEA
jgi:flagellar protein FliS